MKKVFLSLATIAFVAVGSLTMTSCGSDDSTTNPGGENPGGENPGGENPGGIKNFVKVNGETLELDSNTFLIQSTADKKLSVIKTAYEEGGEEYVVTEWVAAAWLKNGDQKPEYELQVYFDVEAKEGSTAGTYGLQLPNQTENVFPYRITVIKDGKAISDTKYAFGKVEVNFNVFNLGESSLEVDYNGNNSVDDTKFNFNGASGMSLTQWYTPQSAKSSSNMKVLKNLDSSVLKN